MRYLQQCIVVASVLAPIAFVSSVQAQSWSAEQEEVWGVVEASWEAGAAKDITWIERLVHANFRGWGTGFPMSRDRANLQRWARYEDENSTTLIFELYSVAIVVQGNTAVAHYYYSVATEDRKGEQKTTHGRVTDVLVREGEAWKFIAWHGGDEPTEND